MMFKIYKRKHNNIMTTLIILFLVILTCLIYRKNIFENFQSLETKITPSTSISINKSSELLPNISYICKNKASKPKEENTISSDSPFYVPPWKALSQLHG